MTCKREIYQQNGVGQEMFEGHDDLKIATRSILNFHKRLDEKPQSVFHVYN